MQTFQVPYPLQTVELLHIFQPMTPSKRAFNSPGTLCCKLCQGVYKLVSGVLAVGFHVLPENVVLAVPLLKNLCKCTQQCALGPMLLGAPKTCSLVARIHRIEVEVEVEWPARKVVEVPCAKVDCPHQGMYHSSMLSNVCMISKVNVHR